MKKLYLVPAAIAIGALYSPAALAQPEQAPVVAPAAETPVTPATEADPATPAAPAAPTGSAPGAMSPTAIVENEFASYDLNKDGGLDETEFAAWVSKLRTPAPDGAAQEDAESWAAGLFARADTDRDQAVSKTEMASLLNAARQG